MGHTQTPYYGRPLKLYIEIYYFPFYTLYITNLNFRSVSVIKERVSLEKEDYTITLDGLLKWTTL